MSKLIFITSLFVWLGITSEDKTVLLSGDGKKSWHLYSITPESGLGSCLASSNVSLDNTYVFHSNGTFEFDHGQVIEDAGCQGEGCCSDFKNLVGTWTFTNNQKGLRVVAIHPKDEADNQERVVLFNATIDLLDEGVLRISQPNPETNGRTSLEFRKRTN